MKDQTAVKAWRSCEARVFRCCCASATTPIEAEEVLRVTFAALSRWECDFCAFLCSSAQKADGTDRAIESRGRCRQTALADSKSLSVSGTGATPSAGTTGAWEGLNPDGQRAPRPELEADGEASGLTILLADDEAAIRNLAGQVLRSHGYTVLEAADGLEALEVAERHPGPIHLLLTDWSMPRLDGGGLIRRLSDGHPETAILVMSGYMNGELPPNSAILRKPFNSQALVESVSGALQGQ